jgi:hypothetical protein
MSNYPKLLVQKSKHYTSHYLIKSEKDKHKVALKIIKSWQEMGYLYLDKTTPKTFSEFCLKETGLTEAELSELKSDPKLSKVKVSLRGYSSAVSVVDEIKRLTEDYKRQVQENDVVKKAKEAVKTKDGSLAWKVIQYYRDAEYMGTEEINFEEMD